MIELLFVANSASVGVFGALLSASFSDIKWTKRNKMIYASAMIILAILQMMLYVLFDRMTLRNWYPLITHLPLMILITLLSHKLLWSVTAVLSAYLCCQIRRWAALLFVGIFSGTEVMQASIELAVTIPLLLLLIKYASPLVRSMSYFSTVMQLQFSVIPTVNYLFDYITRIYTDWLIRGVPAAVEFMPFVCSVAYLFFALYSAEHMRKQNEMEQIQAVLDLQVKQASSKIAEMKKSQEMSASYRHDLRHHMQYISVCIRNGALDQAQDYIYSLTNEIAEQAVVQYCENTAVNLVISAFAGRAAEVGIPMKVKLGLKEYIHISESDFCVLLSNALENALHACAALKYDGKKASIEVRGYEKNEKVFLEIINTCDDNVILENGIPVTKEKGHGTGVRSICAVVDKYNGIYSFEVRDGHFILRLHL